MVPLGKAREPELLVLGTEGQPKKPGRTSGSLSLTVVVKKVGKCSQNDPPEQRVKPGGTTTGGKQ